MDFKYSNLKLVDLDKAKGVVRHYWSAFENLDSDQEIITRGSYARSIAERGPKSSQPRIKFLWQHMRQEVRGVPTELSEEPAGLLATTQITLGRPNREGEDLLILYDANVITEHSVGIDILKRDEEDRRRIDEIRLWEGSAVTWGANPLTPLVDMKSENLDSWVDDQIERAEIAMNAGITDSRAHDFEIWRNILKAYRKEIGTVKHPEEPTNNPLELDSLTSLNRKLKARLLCLT